MSSPLKGIRVLELGQFIAGPYAGLQLADLGATVIKIERPEGGDAFREFGFAANAKGYSHNFCAFNRNKLSVTLDINSPGGQAAFRRMAAQADVVLENFRAGTMKRLGFDYDSLRAQNPRLVYCSIAGFAEDGPYGDRPAYDAVGQALSGLMSLFVDPKDPRTLGPTLSDQVTGMQACMAVLAALYERNRSGTGARVEVTMVEASMALIPDSFTAYTHAGHVMQPESRAAVSLSFAFACSDGKLIAIHVSSMEKFWRALLAAVGRTDLGEDARFRDRMGRIKNYEALVQALRPVFAAKPRSYWAEKLAAHDVPAAVVHSIPEAMDEPEVKHLGMLHELDHPRYGRKTAMRRATRIGGERESQPLPPPALGEHTDAVLRDFGFVAEEVASLRAAGAI
ncbi:MAG TPA: CaiB/BaiF CoA-transferase family protein [Burkholderiales bacterium]|nr:CaiB/BaiF CoA-transferase family protein [Burkholderiales bacterium]